MNQLAVDGKEKSKDFEEVMDIKVPLEEHRFINLREYKKKNRSMSEMLCVDLL